MSWEKALLTLLFAASFYVKVFNIVGGGSFPLAYFFLPAMARILGFRFFLLGLLLGTPGMGPLLPISLLASIAGGLYFAGFPGREFLLLVPTVLFLLLKPSAYPLLWMVGLFLGSGDAFKESLGATLASHAVGSLLFLLLVNPNLPWDALLPIATVERIIFALGNAGVYSLAFTRQPLKALQGNNLR